MVKNKGRRKTKRQVLIAQLEREITALEQSYSETKSLDVRDELIITKRQYLKCKGDPLIGSLYTDNDSLDKPFLRKIPFGGITL